jgi:hypothetical protein
MHEALASLVPRRSLRARLPTCKSLLVARLRGNLGIRRFQQAWLPRCSLSWHTVEIGGRNCYLSNQTSAHLNQVVQVQPTNHRAMHACMQPAACSFGWWLVLICSKKKYCWLLAGGWFVLREKYCCLVADKPNEQGAGQAWLGLLVRCRLESPG